MFSQAIFLTKRQWQRLPLWCPIMGTHLHRLGFLRVATGALGMYLSIPVFMLVHIFVIQLVLRLAVFPLLDLKYPGTRRFIILDRYKVKGLSVVDKFHCLFCGWVNGICLFLDNQTDFLSTHRSLPSVGKRGFFVLLGLIYTPAALSIQLVFFLIYNYLIAVPLELEKVYYTELILRYFRQTPYAAGHSPWTRRFLTYQKITWQGLSVALKQIESAWCPIRHFEKMNGVRYPDHHKLFFEPQQIDALRRHLALHGSVLSKENN